RVMRGARSERGMSGGQCRKWRGSIGAKYSRPKASQEPRMIAVIFEFTPAPGRFPDYMAIVDTLKSDLEKAVRFMSLERFVCIISQGTCLALRFWKDEESVREWRHLQQHREARKQRRARIFPSYRLRTAGVIRDDAGDERAQAPAH